ncbi:MAG: malonyl-CoA decarboxylase family protein, partial [Acidimicrobiia bacterium]|nr:malonyl-CoA decarboxylase family protein [Acidimicrobiia bacterium]
EWVMSNASHIRALVPVELPSDPANVRDLQSELSRLAAEFIARERRTSSDPNILTERAVDPVAHFHLSNGAQLDRINWWANRTPTGWARSFGMMVNYRYDPDKIEERHDEYAATGNAPLSDEVKKILDS